MLKVKTFTTSVDKRLTEQFNEYMVKQEFSQYSVIIPPNSQTVMLQFYDKNEASSFKMHRYDEQFNLSIGKSSKYR